MRLLITTDTAGGVWSFGLELAEGLLEAGDSVALVSFGFAASQHQQAQCAMLRARWADRFAFVDAAVPLEWMQQNERCMEQGAETLRQAAGALNADLLHSNQFCYGAAQVGLPTLVTAHSDVFSWARALGRQLEPSAWLDRYRHLVQAGLHEAEALAAPTRWMLQALEQEFTVPPVRAVIPNGLTLRALKPKDRQLRAVTAGRLWDPGKGLDVLRGLKSPMPIAVAGAPWCEETAVAVPQGATMLGVLQPEELLQLFRESALYICASLYEPFGLAPLEAALCGCAIVARDIPSLREVWNGAASYFQDAEDLSRLLTDLFANPQMLQEAQSRAGKHARRYTRERMVNTYRELYRGVIAGERMSVA